MEPNGTNAPTPTGETWRDRAVERSVRAARAKAESATDRFIQAALAIIGETGQTDFTVREVVDQAKSSFRDFYQHLNGKDDLLLAVLEEVVATSTATWRAHTDSLSATAALRVLIERVTARGESDAQDSINRALSIFNSQLADARPRDYAYTLLPMRDLVRDVLEQGVASGEFRTDADLDALATLVLNTLLSAARFQAIGAELPGESPSADLLLAFCVSGLHGTAQLDPKGPHPRPGTGPGD